MEFKRIDLKFNYNDLEPFIDSKTVKIHYENHHKGYEEKFNLSIKGKGFEKYSSIKEVMNDFKNINDELKNITKNAGGGLINHNFYWNQFVINRELTKEEFNIREELILFYGSINELKRLVKEACLSLFGSGWVWVIKQKNEFKIIQTPNQENPWMQNLEPVIGIDVWEHAYYLKHNSNREAYIDDIWNLLAYK